ncbi:hypothetical protein C1I92_08700 [Jiangella anatolica]|uniref:Uncharacterized protein n=1 Tax=Jiangella anatolica TaxID=2670374 RepID=A0A2W2BEU2_9ACTN|nr:hypothetical protein C1I92_08700 [Jiangella anatolica]
MRCEQGSGLHRSRCAPTGADCACLPGSGRVGLRRGDPRGEQRGGRQRGPCRGGGIRRAVLPSPRPAFPRTGPRAGRTAPGPDRSAARAAPHRGARREGRRTLWCGLSH